MLRPERAVALCLAATLTVRTTPSRAHGLEGMGGIGDALFNVFVITSVVPDYSLVSFDGSTHSGMQWEVPLEFQALWTHTVAPSFSWYPGADDATFRATYRAQLALADMGFVLGISPGIGYFTSRTRGDGPRFELRAWACEGDMSGLNTRRLFGLFAGSAIEVDRRDRTRGWELVAGLEFPIPIDWVLFGER